MEFSLPGDEEGEQGEGEGEDKEEKEEEEEEEDETGEKNGVPLEGKVSLVSSCLEECSTVEHPNNRHIRDKHFVDCSEVVPSSEVEMYGQYLGRGRTVFPGCPLFGVSILEAPLYSSPLFPPSFSLPPSFFPAVSLKDVKDVTDPLSKVEAGLQASGADVPLQSVHVRAQLLDLAAKV